ncbi:MAG: hypothetical protein ABIJ46_02310 [bacterium]
MPTSIERQISETIGRSSQALVVLRKDWSVDAVASALALTRLIERSGKKVDMVADGFVPTRRIGFLPNTDRIAPEIRQARQFVISLDLSRAKVDELTYHLEGDRLNFRLTAKEGQFNERDVTARTAEFSYDLVVTVGAPDLGSLGRTFSDNADLFYRVPLVNIDRDPGNENYGGINFVDITAASCSELVHRLYASPDNDMTHDEDTATMLLGGLIDATRSFRSPHVTPRTLNTASELVAAGGRREEIVRHLYKTRSVSTLRLWGRTLARLKYDPETRLVWSLLLRQDFVHAGSTPESLPDVMDELMVNTPDAEIAGLIYEQDARDGEPAGICALITSERQSDVLGLVPDLKPEGNRRLARICFPGKTLQEAERLVLASLRQSVGKPKPRTETGNELPNDTTANVGGTKTDRPKSADTTDGSSRTETNRPDLLKELTAVLRPENLKAIDGSKSEATPRQPSTQR